jgi:phosphoribosylglycinamide formyltransferase-1
MGPRRLNLAFLASHRGSSLQRVIDACRTGQLPARPCVVISNNRDAEALARTRRAEILDYHLSRQTHLEPARLDTAIRDTLVPA